MKIRSGVYTVYEKYIFRVSSDKNSFLLFYDGDNCPLENFKKNNEGIYFLDVPQENLTNIFDVITKCIYKNYTFYVNAQDHNKYRIFLVWGGQKPDEVFLKLNIPQVDRGVYEAWIDGSEIERMWEERKCTNYYGLPFPKGFSEIDEIKFK